MINVMRLENSRSPSQLKFCSYLSHISQTKDDKDPMKFKLMNLRFTEK